jgi:hypothetical protein
MALQATSSSRQVGSIGNNYYHQLRHQAMRE